VGVDEVEHLADLIGFGHATFGALEIDKRNGRHRMNEDHVIADRAVVLKSERLNTTAAALPVVKVRGLGRDSMGILAAIG
jgi:hypothetical protein